MNFQKLSDCNKIEVFVRGQDHTNFFTALKNFFDKAAFSPVFVVQESQPNKFSVSLLAVMILDRFPFTLKEIDFAVKNLKYKDEYFDEFKRKGVFICKGQACRYIDEAVKSLISEVTDKINFGFDLTFTERDMEVYFPNYPLSC